MKNPDTQEIITRALKGKLNGSEQQEFDRRLQSDAELRAAWQLEHSLEEALDALPNAPVSNNFTSLVMQAALREGPPPKPVRSGGWLRFALPRIAIGFAMILVLGVTLFQQNQKAQSREMAKSVSDFNQVTLALGSEEAPDLFANFEAIQRLNLPAESELDLELLAALQK